MARLNNEEAEKILNSSNYISLNKELIKKIGIDKAFSFSTLLEIEEKAERKKEVVDIEGFSWFKITVIEFAEKIMVSERTAGVMIKELIDLGLIDAIFYGIPRSRYLKIDYDYLNNLILK